MATPITEQRWRAEVPDWRNDGDVSPHPSDVYITDTEGWQATVAWVRAEGLGWADVESRARLMAAAPELLAAVEEALWLLDRVAGWDGYGEPITKYAARLHGDTMRAAIARAEGRTDGR